MKAVKLSVIALAVVVMSCQKDQNLLTPIPGSGSSATTEQVADSQDEGRLPGPQARIELEEGPMSQEQIDYMNSLPAVTEAEMDYLEELLNEFTYSPGAESQQVWGCGIDNRVYKWNGSAWFEPAPGAALDYVQVASLDNSIWGIGTDQKVYKVVGTSLVEPNPQMALYKLTVLNSNIAIGVGNQGKLYATFSGGQNWGYILGTNYYHEIATGNMNELDNSLYGVKDNGVTKHWQDGVFVTLTNAPASCGDISTGPIPGWVVVRESITNKVYVSGDNGFSFNEPNTAANFRVISARTPDDMWAIAPGPSTVGGRVFYSSNGGGTWTEPNPTARLRHISSN